MAPPAQLRHLTDDDDAVEPSTPAAALATTASDVPARTVTDGGGAKGAPRTVVTALSYASAVSTPQRELRRPPGATEPPNARGPTRAEEKSHAHSMNAVPRGWGPMHAAKEAPVPRAGLAERGADAAQTGFHVATEQRPRLAAPPTQHQRAGTQVARPESTASGPLGSRSASMTIVPSRSELGPRTVSDGSLRAAQLRSTAQQQRPADCTGAGAADDDYAEPAAVRPLSGDYAEPVFVEDTAAPDDRPGGATDTEHSPARPRDSFRTRQIHNDAALAAELLRQEQELMLRQIEADRQMAIRLASEEAALHVRGQGRDTQSS